MSSAAVKQLIVVGDTGIGKTCLVMRYTKNEFSDDEMATLLNTVPHTPKVRGEDKDILIVDTAGIEELFDAVSDNYLVNGDGFLLVADATSPKSIDRAAELRTQILEKQMKTEPNIVLAVNKCDLIPAGESSEAIDAARELAKTWHMPFFVCSAKESNNVATVFQSVAEDMFYPGSYWQKQEASGSASCTITEIAASKFEGLKRHNWMHAKPSPFCTVEVAGTEVARTKKLHNTGEPVWNIAQTFTCQADGVLIVKIYDHHNVRSNILLASHTVDRASLKEGDNVVVGQGSGDDGIACEVSLKLKWKGLN